MTKVEFTNELTEKAMGVYSDSSFTFWKDEDGTFFYGFNSNDTPSELGTLEDVNAFLEEFAEEEE